MLTTLLGRSANELRGLWKVKTDLFLDDFSESYVCNPHVAYVANEGASHASATGVQLAHAARDQVYENVRIPNFLQSFFSEFSVQASCPKVY